MKQSLKAWRESVGLTQMQLAVAAGLHPNQINTYERGHVSPRLETALVVVAALRKAGARIVSVEDVDFSASRKSSSAA